MPESGRSLSQDDIDRLGRMAGMHVMDLSDNFNGGEQPEVIERIVLDLGMEAISMANQRLTAPEEFTTDDSF